MANPIENPPLSPWREKLRVIIFEADTPAGKAFDVGLLVAIFLSVFAVMLDSVSSFRNQYEQSLNIAEWGFTLLFSDPPPEAVRIQINMRSPTDLGGSE